MIGIQIKDEKVGNDLWVVLDHITAVTVVNDDLKGLEVHLTGGETLFINKWTMERWIEFFDQTVRRIQIASAGGMRPQ